MGLVNLPGGRWATNPMSEPSACAVDFEQIMQVTEGDREFVQDLIDIYTEDAPRQFEALKAGLQANDLKSVEESAHKMKGSSSNMGFWKLELLSYLLLSMARNHRVDEGELIVERMMYENNEALRTLEYAVQNNQMVSTPGFFRHTVRAWGTLLSGRAVMLRQAAAASDLATLAREAATLEEKAASAAFWQAERSVCGLRYSAESGSVEHIDTWITLFEQGIGKVLAYLDVRR